jgi:hypothetical protein
MRIEDYGLIGNLRTAALVAAAGPQAPEAVRAAA